MTAEQTKIAQKIKALLAKAASSEHEAEAEAFMAKAQQLLEEYQIDASTLEGSDDPVKVHYGMQKTRKDPTWQKKPYTALATLYGCKIVYAPMWVRNQPGFQVELTGRESAFITTELMYPWIKSQCEAQGRELAKEYPQFTSAQHTRRVANALYFRIHALAAKENAPTKPRTEAAAANALVTQDRTLQVFNDHYGETLGKARAGRSSTNAAARDAASKIGLHRQTGGSSILQLR